MRFYVVLLKQKTTNKKYGPGLRRVLISALYDEDAKINVTARVP